MPLKIAAKVDKVDEQYFESVVKPLLDGRHVDYVGEINEREKNEFLGSAIALLFPIDWPEPFGLVMIEAMACGTPIIASVRGSVPEVMEEGQTGFVIKDLDGAVRAVKEVSRLDRQRCRKVFEKRFTATRMATEYVHVYERLVDSAFHRREEAHEPAH
jgi:glycosyltransferase involved in cell wall biosynthesis